MYFLVDPGLSDAGFERPQKYWSLDLGGSHTFSLSYSRYDLVGGGAAWSQRSVTPLSLWKDCHRSIFSHLATHEHDYVYHEYLLSTNFKLV